MLAPFINRINTSLLAHQVGNDGVHVGDGIKAGFWHVDHSDICPLFLVPIGLYGSCAVRVRQRPWLVENDNRILRPWMTIDSAVSRIANLSGSRSGLHAMDRIIFSGE
jgi:hypothetical protein